MSINSQVKLFDLCTLSFLLRVLKFHQKILLAHWKSKKQVTADVYLLEATASGKINKLWDPFAAVLLEVHARIINIMFPEQNRNLQHWSSLLNNWVMPSQRIPLGSKWFSGITWKRMELSCIYIDKSLSIWWGIGFESCRKHGWILCTSLEKNHGSLSCYVDPHAQVRFKSPL